MAIPAWHTIPRARAILAQIVAADLLPVRKFKLYGCVREDWHEYQGPLVETLSAIRDEYGERALRRTTVTGESCHVTEWAALGSVHDIIDAAFRAAACERLAA